MNKKLFRIFVGLAVWCLYILLCTVLIRPISQKSDFTTDAFSLKDFRFTIIPKSWNLSNTLSVLLCVKSAVFEFEQRVSIRQTYSSGVQQFNMKVLFFVGHVNNESMMAQIRREADRYDDIVQANFSDTYRNLQLKSYAILRYQVKSPRANFYFSLDSDVLVIPKYLHEFVMNLGSSNNSIYGACKLYPIEKKYLTVVREKAHKWYVPENIWANDTFPPYCVGSGYLLTGDVPEKLINVINGGPDNWSYYKDFPIEDVLFSGILAKYAKVTLIYDRLAHTYFFNKYNLCNPLEHIVSAHRFGSHRMIEVYTKIHEQIENC